MRRELVTDQAIAAIADRQGGVIARRQLLALGVGASAVDRRLRGGSLHTVHRGVYSVGHRVLRFTWEQVTERRDCLVGAVLHALATS